jgi:hypothetical protein
VRRKNWTITVALMLMSGAAAFAEPEFGPPAPTSSQRESRALGAPGTVFRPPSPSAPRTSDNSWIGRTTVSLGGVLGVAVAAGAAIRIISKRQGGLRASLGAGGRSPAGILEVLGRYPVGRGATLVLLKLDRRVLLLSQTAVGKLGLGSAFAPLCEITDPEEVASILVKSRDADGDSMAERFRSMLTKFDGAMPTAEPPTGRQVRAMPSGDRAELWTNGRADIPVVDLTTRPEGSTVQVPGGAAGTLRRRLAAIRWPEQQGADAP